MHTYVVLAYKQSEYLEECIKSVLNQKYQSKVIIATSTPNEFISKIAKKYSLEVGTYMDYVQTMPFPSCYTEEEVVNTIMENHFDLDRIEAFNQVYFKYHDSNSTQRIMSFIDQIIQG